MDENRNDPLKVKSSWSLLAWSLLKRVAIQISTSQRGEGLQYKVRKKEELVLERKRLLETGETCMKTGETVT
jgi:hypothetical protein